ncbi:MAG TPA: hypothetical protein VMZ92_16815 [Planctomycetota bacterium]|nr:hypothetical protein [Planctomycetota bacterium]
MTMVGDERIHCPGTVTAVAVMGFILGGLVVTTATWAIVRLSLHPEQMEKAATLNRGWVMVSVPAKLVLGAAWIFTGAGLLRLRSWARTAAVALLVLGIAIDVAGGGVAVTTIRRMELPPEASMPAGSRELVKTIALATAVVVLCLWLAYSIVMLVLITRPSAGEAFQRAALARAQTPQTGPPRQTPPPVPPDL